MISHAIYIYYNKSFWCKIKQTISIQQVVTQKRFSRMHLNRIQLTQIINRVIDGSIWLRNMILVIMLTRWILIWNIWSDKIFDETWYWFYDLRMILLFQTHLIFNFGSHFREYLCPIAVAMNPPFLQDSGHWLSHSFAHFCFSYVSHILYLMTSGSHQLKSGSLSLFWSR